MDTLKEKSLYCLMIAGLPLLAAGALYAGSQAPAGMEADEIAKIRKEEIRIEREVSQAPVPYIILSIDDPRGAPPPYLLEHLEGLEPIAPVPPMPALPDGTRSASLDTEAF